MVTCQLTKQELSFLYPLSGTDDAKIVLRNDEINKLSGLCKKCKLTNDGSESIALLISLYNVLYENDSKTDLKNGKII